MLKVMLTTVLIFWLTHKTYGVDQLYVIVCVIKNSINQNTLHNVNNLISYYF